MLFALKTKLEFSVKIVLLEIPGINVEFGKWNAS